MKRQGLALVVVWAAVAVVVTAVLWAAGPSMGLGVNLLGGLVRADTAEAPTVTEVNPSSGSNASDTPVVITGTGFTEVPTLYLGLTMLDEVGWVSSETLTATVPWGLEPGVYTMTAVITPGEAGILTDAFTVTQGFDVWTTGGPYGGQVIDMEVHPVTPTTVFAVVFQVGVFASYDAGDSWEMLLVDDWPTRITIDAVDPLLMYVGGDGGLLRTEDGGGTWESISPPEDWQVWEQYRPLAHPTLGDVVYVGVTTPDDPGESDGIFWSQDGGDTWELRATGVTDTQVIDLAFDPADADHMLAATTNGHIFETMDGGALWAWKAQAGTHAERLFIDPQAPHEGWLTAKPLHEQYSDPSLYKSVDLVTWEPITVPRPAYDLHFVSDTVWAAAGDIYTSTDGGENWTLVDAPGMVRQDHRNYVCLAGHPADPLTIWAGDEGDGVSGSMDGGPTWAEKNQGLAGVVPQALAVTPSMPDVVYANTAGRGLFKSNNGGQSWRSLDYYTGGPPWRHVIAVEPLTPTRVYLGSSGTSAWIFKISENGGEDWREVTATLPLTWDGEAGIASSVAPHPRVAGRILAGVSIDHSAGMFSDWPGLVFGSDDYGESWEFLFASETFSMVVDFAFDAVDDDLVYAAASGSGLWKSSDGGASWDPVTTLHDNANLTSLAAHPALANVIYVLAEDVQGSNVYVSEDAGENWEHLTDAAGVEVKIAPPNPGAFSYALYTGCGAFFRGTCRSADGGQTWTPVPGSPRFTSLTTGGDGERVLVYIGSPGGTVPETEVSLASVGEIIPGRGKVLGSGVYQHVGLEVGYRVYLPVVVR